MDERDRLIKSIEHLESQREVLGNDVVDTALIPLRDELSTLDSRRGIPDRQRKQVTILFTDIVDSTKVAQHLDPEDTRDIFDGALKRLSEPIEAHEGHVSRFMGDGFKAVFGAPLAQENDPEQAIRAGLEILDTAQELAGELQDQWDIENFQVRVGIDTGLAALGGQTEAEDTVMGRVVNLAVRIESAAPPGGLLISHNTYRHVRGVFNVEPQEPITAKGFPDPVQVYLVEEIKPRAFRVQTRGVEGVETHMVGRRTELDTLKDALFTIFEEGEGHVVTIAGEAGIGKSRLLYEFQNWLELQPPSKSVRFFLSRSEQEFQGLPYSLLRDLFVFRFQILDDNSGEQARQKIEKGFGDVFGDDEDTIMKSHIIGQLLGFDFSASPHLKGVLNDPEQLRNRGLIYLIQYFQAFSQEMPVVIFLEDIHWADDSSLDFVNRLGEKAAELRILIVCAARHRLFERRSYWGEGQGFHTLLELRPLSKRESRNLVAEILKLAEDIPAELRELVVRGAEGNPFYTEELIKMLIEDRVIIPDEETWRIDLSRLEHVDVPSTLAGVLQARLDSLPTHERTVLQQASVVGRLFWDRIVSYIQSEGGYGVDPALIPQTLTSLRDRELVFRHEDSAFVGTVEYLFKHDVLRKVTYESVIKPQRKTYHGLVADWLINNGGDRIGEYSGLIAEHYRMAGNKSSASDWYFRAGQQAKHQLAMQEARAYIAQAKELLPTDELQKRWLVQLELDEIVGILGDKDERSSAKRELLNLARQLDDDNLIAHAYYRQAFFFNSQGDYQSELTAHEKALSAARRANNLLIETTTLGLKVVCLTFLGELDQAREIADLALAYARQVGDDDALAKVLGNVSIYYQVVDISRAARLIKESIEIEDRLGDLNIKSINMHNLGYIYTQTGLFKEGVDTFKSSLEIATKIENPRMVAYNQLNIGLAYYRLGDHERSFESLETAQHILREIGDTFAGATCQTYLGLNHDATGKCDLATELFKEAYETLNLVGTPGFAIDALAGSARCALEMGNLAQAVEYADEICAYLEKNGPEAMEFPILAYLTCARVFEKAGDQERRQRSIEDGYKQLMVRAEKISDPEWRRIFIEDVQENQEIGDFYHS